MAKIPNWSREQKYEDKTMPFYWEHDKRNQQVIVDRDRQRGGYTVLFFDIGERPEKMDYPSVIIAETARKEDARGNAIMWMENHPNP